MSLKSNIEDEWRGALEHCSQILVWFLDLAKLGGRKMRVVKEVVI
jgi:hypothetical protein